MRTPPNVAFVASDDEHLSAMRPDRLPLRLEIAPASSSLAARGFAPSTGFCHPKTHVIAGRFSAVPVVVSPPKRRGERLLRARPDGGEDRALVWGEVRRLEAPVWRGAAGAGDAIASASRSPN
jgi:hypothetical protein